MKPLTNQNQCSSAQVNKPSDTKWTKNKILVNSKRRLKVTRNVKMNVFAETDVKCVNCCHAFNIGSDPVRGNRRLDNKRIPLVLHCAHNICHECVPKTEKVTCQRCQATTPLTWRSENFTDVLPVNYNIYGALAFNARERNQKEPESRMIRMPKLISGGKASARELCGECFMVPATLECQQCATLFCSSCSSKVHRFRSLQAHRIAAIGAPRSNLPPGIYCKAPGHDDNIAALHCVTCHVHVCHVCAFESHRYHETSDLNDRKLELMERMREHEPVLERLQNLLRNSVKDLNRTLKTTQHNQVNAIKLQIRDHFLDAYGRLRAVEARAMQNVHAYSTYKLDALTEVRKQISENLDKVNVLRKSMQSMETIASSYDTLETLREEVEEILRCECAYVTVANDVNKDGPEFNLAINDTILTDLDNFVKFSFEKPVEYKLVRYNDIPENLAESLMEPERDTSVLGTSQSSTPGILRPNLTTSPASKLTLSTSHLSLSSETKSDDKPIEAGSFLDVTVAHVKNPSCFFVQLARDERKLKKCAEEYAAAARRSNVPDEICKGSVYYAQHSNSPKKRHYRVKITNIFETPEDQLYEAFFIDFGFKDMLKKNLFREIHDNTHRFAPPMAYKCQLHNVKPHAHTGWTDGAIRSMVEMLNGSYVKMNVFTKEVDTLCVDLVNSSQRNGRGNVRVPTSITSALVFLGYAVVVETENQPKPISYMTFANMNIMDHPLSNNANGKVFITYYISPSLFYVQFTSKKHVLDEMYARLKREYLYESKNATILDPRAGLKCAVLVNLKWYRAEILAATNCHVTVSLIDRGQRVTVPYTDIRNLMPQFYTTHSLVIPCRLSDVDPLTNTWSDEAIQYLRKIILKKVFWMQVNDASEKPRAVSLYDQTDGKNVNVGAVMCQQMNLARSAGINSVRVVNPTPEPEQPPTPPAETEMTNTEFQKPTATVTTPTQHNVLPPDEPIRVSVTIEKVVSPTLIFVKKVDNPKLSDLLREMNQEYNHNQRKVLLSDFRTSRSQKYAVHVKTTGLNGWYRAVANADDEMQLLDYHRTITLGPHVQMAKLDDKFAQIPAAVLRVRLWGVLAAGGGSNWPLISTEKLNELVDAYPEFYMSQKGPVVDGTMPVELWVRDVIVRGALDPYETVWYNLNDCLVECGVAIKDLTATSSSRFECGLLGYENDDARPTTCSTNMIDDQSDNTSASVTEQPDVTHWLPALPLPTATEFPAYICHVDASYIYFRNLATRNSLDTIEQQLKAIYQNRAATFENVFWQIGDACVVYQSDKDKYARGMLVAGTVANYEVLLVDVGTTITCSVRDLRHAKCLSDVPILCQRAPLNRLNLEREHAIVKIMICDRDANLTVVEDGDEYAVDISICSINFVDLYLELIKTIPNVDDLSTAGDDVRRLFDQKLVALAMTRQIGTSLTTNQFPRLHIPAHVEWLNVKVVAAGRKANEWTVQPIQDNEHLNMEFDVFVAMSAQIAAMERFEPIAETDLRMGLCCLARFTDNQYYRAKIVEPIVTNRSSVTVVFIDFGNVENVSKSYICKMPNKFLNVPEFRLEVRLHNVRVPAETYEQEEVVEKISGDCLLDEECRMKICARDEEFFVVELYQFGRDELMYKMLIDQKFYELVG